ncbi:helix-turn-helix transcriptional regulator [Micromonospora zhanjiangensis]
MARLRTRLGISQQVFADRVGRSVSWVDKVERGVRRLDRVSVIELVAQALGVTPDLLLDQDPRPEPATGTAAAVDRVRAALACYDPPGAHRGPPPPATPELADQVGYAWAAYRHAQHPQVLRLLPDLLTAARRTPRSAPTTDPLVRVYRLAAHVLVKLGEPDLAWLAADRAIGTAVSDPHRTGLAVIPLAQALRSLDRGRLALAATITAVHRLAPPPAREPAPAEAALAGTLLVQAALAAAGCGDASSAHELTVRATDLAHGYGDKLDHDGADELGFGPTVVEIARALVALELGDNERAIATHLEVTGSDRWPRLPAEHRAAHLIDITRAYLNVGDHRAAGHALVTADRLAPAETRLRPAARTALAAVLRAGPALADVTGLATAVGLMRQ